jgi:hypothetical protein
MNGEKSRILNFDNLSRFQCVELISSQQNRIVRICVTGGDDFHFGLAQRW